MPRSFDRRAPGWFGLLGVLATSLGAMGCPGNLDPSLIGGSGSGGTSGGGGTSGSNCTGALDGATLVTTNCAVSGCHVPGGLQSAGLDLTVDATIGTRLVGILSAGDTTHGSLCAGWPTPYLKPGSNPAAGLIIDKISLKSGNAALCPSGDAMPWPGITMLPAAQQACIEEWAEGLIMAAGTQ